MLIFMIRENRKSLYLYLAKDLSSAKRRATKRASSDTTELIIESKDGIVLSSKVTSGKWKDVH